MFIMLGAITLADVAGLIRDLFDKLTGADGQLWLLAFKRFLRRENPWDLKTVWCALTIGGAPKENLLQRFKETGRAVSDWARDIINQQTFTTLGQQTEVQLVRLKVSDLGFEIMPTTIDLFGRAKKYGLGPCPPEVGPYLYPVDAGQPNDTVYWIAMEPITDSGGRSHMFCIERHNNGQRLLAAPHASPEIRWNLDDVFIFRLGK